jgi:hypothetical protein
VDLVRFVSGIDQRIDNNLMRNKLSQSKKMFFGIPKCTHTRSKKILVVAFVVMHFLQVVRITILEK